MNAAGVDASYLAFFSFTFILVVTPGSTTAVVVRNTLEGGHRAGYATAAGAALANTVIAVVCGLGLSALSPAVVNVIRIGGGLFLATLGATSLRRAWLMPDGGIRLSIDPQTQPASPKLAGQTGKRRWGYVGDGLAINLLSPVIISFYLSVVPSFIPAAASRFYYPMLAGTHVGLAFLCHSMWASALAAMRRWFVEPWKRRLLQAATGAALIALAISVVL